MTAVAGREPIAVVGMSCLFPGARDLDAFWANVVGGVDSVGEAPADSWDPALHYDPTFADEDKVYVRRGGYLGDLAAFDPLPHGIPPIAVGGEPDQWLALQLARDALADAGCLDLPASVRARTGVVLGKGAYVNGGNAIAVQRGLVLEQTLALLGRLSPGLDEQRKGLLRKEILAVLPPLGPETVPGLIPNVIVGRIANRLDLMGPTYTVDAACASSLVAVQLAVNDLRSGASDLVVAGGSQVWMPVPSLNVFCRLGALSRSERIRPFDAEADGTLLGEGIGMVVLKRLGDAQRDGDRIYSVVRGAGVASDGRGVGVMAPRVEGEELALRRAYEDAGVDPATVELIEAHGTATPVGDVVEVAALRRVFGERQGELGRVALGSVKSMISHTIPAAGIAGIIKTSLALHHRVLPPTLGVTRPNPALELEKTPFYLNTRTRPWIHGRGAPRRAGCNAFGFGGINAHVVLEEAPGEPAPRHLPPWDCEAFVLEGGSRAELTGNAQRLLQQLTGLLGSGAAPAPVDVAATLAARLGRAASPVRLGIVAATLPELVQRLTAALQRLEDPSCTRIKGVSGTSYTDRPLGREGGLAFLFPGEGAQYVEMLTDLCLHVPEVRQVLDRADGRAGPTLRESVYPPPAFTDAERAAAQQRLHRMDVGIEAVLNANHALLVLTRLLGLRPDDCAGHSCGEYSAAIAAGVLQLDEDSAAVFGDALNAAYRSALSAGELPLGVLLSLGAGREAAEALARQAGTGTTVAMDNCPHQTVLVTTPEAADRLRALATGAGLVCETLGYDRAVHTPAFAAYTARLDGTVAGLPLGAGRARLWSCSAAAPYPADLGDVRALFAGQWAAPVEFRTMVERMHAAGTRVFLEVGPRGNLTGFTDDVLRGRDACAVALDTQRRSGTRQLNLAVAQLAVHDVRLDVSALYAHREHTVDDALLEGPAPARARRPVPLQVGWPSMALSDEAIARTGLLDVTADPAPAPVDPEPVVPAPLIAARGDRDGAMHAHLSTMSDFLSVSEQILAAYFGDAPAGAHPLLGTLVEHDPGRTLLARRVVDLDTDPYLRDHSFGGRVSRRDPSLYGLAVLPFAMSLAVLAEAAAALVPGQPVTGLEQVRASRWLSWDGQPRTLEARAVRLAPGADGAERVTVSLRLADDPEPAVEGVVVLGGAPTGHAPLLAPPTSPSGLPADRLYGADGMFHGPAWQGVRSVDASGPAGARATLTVLDPLTADTHLDAGVLDAAGQVVGFWAAEQLPDASVVFPVGLERLAVTGPRPATGSALTCVTSTRPAEGSLVVSDLDVLRADGTPWLRLTGWADRRFAPPPGMAGLLSGGPAVASRGLPAALEGLGRAAGSLVLRRVDVAVPADTAFWSAIWAGRVLGAAERAAWRLRTDPPGRRLEHLAGRAAAKDAVAALGTVPLAPADIEVLADASGRPVVHRPGPPVSVSIAHSGGVAVALAGSGPDADRLGVDVERRGRRADSFARTAFDPAELGLLDALPEEWALRAWCAKEAVGKAVGTGLVEGPRSVTVVAVDPATGQVLARLSGAIVRAAPDLADVAVLVATWADDEVVLALTTCAPAAPDRPASTVATDSRGSA